MLWACAVGAALVAARPEGQLVASDRPARAVQKADEKDSPAKGPREPKLRDELLARVKDDQAVRGKIADLSKKGGGKLDTNSPAFKEIEGEMRKVDDANRAWVKGVVEKLGYPGIGLVGADGERAAFLLIQHAAADRDFQKKCLELLTAAVKAKDASPGHLAYLTDRVRVVAGEKQLYGTQLTRTKDGELAVSPIEDEAGVDARRKELGLPPLAEYLKLVRDGAGVLKK